MFERLGRAVGRAPARWLAGWLVGVVLLCILCPDEQQLALREPRSLLPDDQPYNVALAFERQAFPQLASRTRTVLIFESDSGLTPEHDRFLRELSAR